jgi:hypothetical protein
MISRAKPTHSYEQKSQIQPLITKLYGQHKKNMELEEAVAESQWRKETNRTEEEEYWAKKAEKQVMHTVTCGGGKKCTVLSTGYQVECPTYSGISCRWPCDISNCIEETKPAYCYDFKCTTDDHGWGEWWVPIVFFFAFLILGLSTSFWQWKKFGHRRSYQAFSGDAENQEENQEDEESRREPDDFMQPDLRAAGLDSPLETILEEEFVRVDLEASPPTARFGRCSKV